ncbi:MAG: glycosyltransferase, partial [Nitrososphaera sp.]|nr:glycosyltransferase [Nitrososphaera sp.]
MTRPFLSVVIPAFNEEARIVPTLETVAAHLSSQPYAWEIVVVDDGSSDATAPLASEWASEGRNARLEKIAHAGKGWAVRHGMLKAEGEFRFMCDADLAMPIAMLDTFIERMGEGYDIVIGSR